tara:strand:- start:100 stop:282 length:183 start_codon:yes stop_codon:yes gene_type:complete
MKLMSNKIKVRKSNRQQDYKLVKEQQPEKNNTLIFGGVLLAMSSIGLLIFVLSEKIFNLS